MKLGGTWMVALALVLVCGAARAEDKTFKNEEDGFSLSLPLDWQKKDGDTVVKLTAISPQEDDLDGFRESITVASEQLPAPFAVADYFAGFADGLKEKEDYKEVEKADVKVADQPAIKLVYTTKDGAVEIQVFQYFLTKGKRGVVITGTSAKPKVDKYKPAFEEAVTTFKLLDPK